MMSRSMLTVLGLGVGLAAVPALAHHRQTPPVTPITLEGDVALPRLPSLGRSTTGFIVPSGADNVVVTVSPYKDATLHNPLVDTGNNQNLAMSYTGTTAAWDTDDPIQTPGPGRQIMFWKRGSRVQAINDPTGTSVNPTLDVAGQRIAFESNNDFTGLNPTGAKQVFLRQSTGLMVQMSSGVGTSGNPVLSPQKGLLAFESTSEPMTGIDTGIAQIWLGSVVDVAPSRLTDGLAPSGKPVISNDGQIVAFESRADLAGNKADLGVPQIFIHHVKSKTFAQITREPAGCTDPAVYRVKQDWRIGYVCSGVGYFYMLRADDRFIVQTPGGDTTRVITELGIHFMVVATTADLVNGGTTAGHRLYEINLYKRPAEAYNPGYAARWFPIRGVPPLF